MDLLIITKSVDTANDGMIEPGFEDDDDLKFEPQIKNKQLYILSNNISDMLVKYNKVYGENDKRREILFTEQKSINFRDAEGAFAVSRDLSFKNNAFHPYNNKRMVILIDRRGKVDKIMCYRMPAEISEIPAEFSYLSCISVSGGKLLPNMSGSVNMRRYFGGMSDSDGQLFCVSFACASADNIRAQWFFNGSGCRFFASHMTKVWPQIFSEQARNRYPLDRNYLKEEYIKKRFRLDLSDPMLDEWFSKIV